MEMHTWEIRMNDIQPTTRLDELIDGRHERSHGAKHLSSSSMENSNG
jgi:hypothetical protein